VVLALALLLLGAEPPLPSGVPAPVKGPNPYLSQAKELYERLDFEKCLKRLGQAPQWISDSAELIEIELYAGMCSYNLNERGDAEERFRLALRMNPDAELPPYTSPKLVDFFLNVKRKLRPTPPPMPKEDLDMPRLEPRAPKVEKEDRKEDRKEDEPPAPPVVKPMERGPEPDEPRVDAAPALVPAPKMIGPILVPEVEKPSALERRAAPIVLTVVAVIAAAVGVGLGVNSRALERQANNAHFESDFFKLGDAARTQAFGADVAYGIAAASGAGALVGWLVTNE